jgi:N utilization substance protein A
MTETEMLSRDAEDQQKVLELFMQHLDVDEDIALVLAEEGFTSIDEVAYVSDEEFLAIEEFDENIVAELRNRAQNALLTMAIAEEGGIPAEDLLTMDGMDEALAYKLAKQGVCSMDDLAELSVDELLEIGDMDEEVAGQLIMTARAPWFAEENDAQQ